MVLAAISQRFYIASEKLSELTAPIVERMAPFVAVAAEVYGVAMPYVVKTFHYGFIPFVLFLGMNSTPQPKFTDLLTPL